MDTQYVHYFTEHLSKVDQACAVECGPRAAEHVAVQLAGSLKAPPTSGTHVPSVWLMSLCSDWSVLLAPALSGCQGAGPTRARGVRLIYIPLA